MRLWPKHFEVPEVKPVNWIDLSNLPATSLEILEINENSHILSESLGVTDERFNELIGKVDSLIPQHTDMVQLLVELNPEFKHVNEVVLCSMVLVKKIEERKMMMQMLQGGRQQHGN